MHNTKVFLVCSILFFAQPFFGFKGIGGSTISQSESLSLGVGPLGRAPPLFQAPGVLVGPQACPGLVLLSWWLSQGWPWRLPPGVACSSCLPGALACFPVRGCRGVCKHQVRVGFSPHQPGLCFPVPSHICPVSVRLIKEPDLIWLHKPGFFCQIQLSLFESLGPGVGSLSPPPCFFKQEGPG